MEASVSFSEGSKNESDQEFDVDEDGDADISGNLAWADAMSKVLGSQASKNKNLILSKARKDRAVKLKKEERQFELVDDSGNPVKLPESNTETKKRALEKEEYLDRQRKKYLWENMCRTKPDVQNKDKERVLAKIATKGVVQLFNAVQKIKTKSKESENEKSPSSQNKSAKAKSATKSRFMDMLKMKMCKTEDKTEDIKTHVPEEKTWSVLKDDFMMGGTMKDWDKDSEED